ncbi:LysR substrate-binding domain-containing protein [Microbacterium sp. P07]|uniref:LysR substrate-binding domain-containing protein n=1 Tax=Microbacterium sp. P07 TaxID=3366952 RepID=UPI0037476DFB
MAGKGGDRRRAAPRKPARPLFGPKKPPVRRKTVARPEPVATVEQPRVFTLGVVPGATPGKWVSAWRDRMLHVELVLVTLAVAEQHEALAGGSVDAAIVRLPLDDSDLHVVRLYDEVPVAIVSTQSHLTAADELELSDLAGEVIIVPADDVLAAEVPGGLAPSFDPPASTEEAIETVAAGVGVVVAPLSLARLFARKDVAVRPLRDAPVSTVALAWSSATTNPDVDTFFGIVRGRTANSSR